MSSNSYPYIRAWSHMMGSMPYYITDQIARARATNAPANAIYEKHLPGGEGPSGEWETFDDIRDESTRARIQADVDKITGKGAQQ